MSINTHFLGWESPALDSAAQYLCSELCQGDDEKNKYDFSNCLIVVPTAEGGRKLLQRLTATVESGAWIPPQIITPGSLAAKLQNFELPAATNLEAVLVRLQTLKQVGEQVLKNLIPVSPEEYNWHSWWSLSEQIGKLFYELTSCGLSAEQLYEKCEKQLIAVEKQERYKALAEIEKQYCASLQAQGLCDEQYASLAQIKNPACSYDGEIVLLATLDLPWLIQQLLLNSGADITALVHAPSQHQNGFNELGVINPSYWKNQKLNLDDSTIHVVDNQIDQAQFVAMNLLNSGLKQEDNLGSACVAMADEGAHVSLERELGFANMDCKYAAGTSLEKTRPIKFLRCLATFASEKKPRLDSVKQMLRHVDIEQFLNAGQGNIADIAFFDRYSNQHLQEYLDGNWLSETSSENEQLQNLYDKLAVLLPADYLNKKTLDKWSQDIADSLSKIYGNLTFDNSNEQDYHLANSLEQIALALLDQQACGKNSSSNESEYENLYIPKVTFAEAVELTLRQLSGKLIAQFPGQGVSLVGLLELSLDDSPIVFITGMNEGNVPTFVNSDPFLPGNIRSALGINDNQRRYGRDFVLLSGAVKSRKYISLIVPKAAAQGDPLAPSRLLFAADNKTVVRRIKHFYGEHSNAQNQKLRLFSKAVLAPGSEDEFLIPQPNPDNKIGAISVTAFRDFLACPYRFYLKHVLGLEVVEQEVELNQAVFGTLIHDVLARFGKSDSSGETKKDTIYKFLLQQLDDIAKARYGTIKRAAVRVQIEQIKLRLENFAYQQAILAEQGWCIEHIEQKLETEIEVDGKPIILKGKIDRIDKHENKGYRIIDYKTSDSGKSPKSAHYGKVDGQEKWKDLQLPLYLELAKQIDIDHAHDEIELCYFNLPKKSEETGIKQFDLDDNLRASAIQTRDEIIKSIFAGKFWPPSKPPTFSDGLERICLDDVINRQEVIEKSRVRTTHQ